MHVPPGIRRLLACLALLPTLLATSRAGPPGRTVERPADETGKRLMIYDDRAASPFIPGGLMPDGRGVVVDLKFGENPLAGEACLRISHRPADNPWVGVAFLLDNQWEPRRKFNLYDAIGARKGDPVVLRLYARSIDGATAKFQVAGLKFDSQALPVQTPWIRLGPEWHPVEIDLSGADLSELHSALTVILDRDHNTRPKKSVIRVDLDTVYVTRMGHSPSSDRK